MFALSTLLPQLVGGLVSMKDKVPDPEDVTAGWLGFWVLIALIVAVVLLGFSLSKHLRRARENAEAGMFDPSDNTPRDREVADGSTADGQLGTGQRDTGATVDHEHRRIP